MHHGRRHGVRLDQGRGRPLRVHPVPVAGVDGKVAIAIRKLHARLSYLDLDRPEPLVPLQVGRRVRQRVVIRAFLDRLGHCLRQSIGVVEGLAAGVLRHGLHRPVLLRPLSLELHRRGGVGGPATQLVCHAEGRIGLHPATVHRIHRNLRARQQVVRLAHRIVVADHRVVRIGLVDIGLDVQRKAGGVPDHVLPPGNAHQVPRQLVERVQGVQHPVVLLLGGNLSIDSRHVVEHLLRHIGILRSSVRERGCAHRPAVDRVRQDVRDLRSPLLRPQRSLQHRHVAGEPLQHVQVRRHAEDGNARSSRSLVQKIDQLLSGSSLCSQGGIEIVQQQHIHRAVGRGCRLVGEQACRQLRGRLNLLRRGRGAMLLEAPDHLQLSIFHQGKIRLLQPMHRVLLRVGDHHIDHHQVGARMDRGNRGRGQRLRPIRRRRRRCWSGRRRRRSRLPVHPERKKRSGESKCKNCLKPTRLDWTKHRKPPACTPLGYTPAKTRIHRIRREYGGIVAAASPDFGPAPGSLVQRSAAVLGAIAPAPSDPSSTR